MSAWAVTASDAVSAVPLSTAMLDDSATARVGVLRRGAIVGIVGSASHVSDGVEAAWGRSLVQLLEQHTDARATVVLTRPVALRSVFAADSTDDAVLRRVAVAQVSGTHGVLNALEQAAAVGLSTAVIIDTPAFEATAAGDSRHHAHTFVSELRRVLRRLADGGAWVAVALPATASAGGAVPSHGDAADVLGRGHHQRIAGGATWCALCDEQAHLGPSGNVVTTED